MSKKKENILNYKELSYEEVIDQINILNKELEKFKSANKISKSEIDNLRKINNEIEHLAECAVPIKGAGSAFVYCYDDGDININFLANDSELLKNKEVKKLIVDTKKLFGKYKKEINRLSLKYEISPKEIRYFFENGF